jgi:hypothetical protein
VTNATQVVCTKTTWVGLPGTAAYHPNCYWTDLCKKRGCVWSGFTKPAAQDLGQQQGLGF